MRKNRLRAPDGHAVKDGSREVLAANANRLYLIVGLAVVVSLLSVYTLSFSIQSVLKQLLLPKAGEWISRAFPAIYWLLMALFTVFVTLPLLFGFLRIAYRAVADGQGILADLFYAFSSAGRYRSLLRLSWRFTAGIALLALTIWGSYRLTVHWFSGDLLAGFLCGVAVLLEIAVAGCLFLRNFPLLALMMEERLTFCEARKQARGMVSRMPCAGFLFFFRFVPSILLGILTVGVLLVADTFPCMAVSYFRYCQSMNELIIRSEE